MCPWDAKDSECRAEGCSCESDEASENSSPDDQPPEVLSDHLLDDLFDHLRRELVESMGHDLADLTEHILCSRSPREFFTEGVLEGFAGADVFECFANFLFERVSQGFQRLSSSHHGEHASERRFGDGFDECFECGGEIGLCDDRFQIDSCLVLGRSRAVEESVDVFDGEELFHHEIMDASFELFEMKGNDPGSVEAGHFFEEHVDRDPICRRPRKGKQAHILHRRSVGFGEKKTNSQAGSGGKIRGEALIRLIYFAHREPLLLPLKRRDFKSKVRFTADCSSVLDSRGIRKREIRENTKFSRLKPTLAQQAKSKGIAKPLPVARTNRSLDRQGHIDEDEGWQKDKPAKDRD